MITFVIEAMIEGADGLADAYGKLAKSLDRFTIQHSFSDDGSRIPDADLAAAIRRFHNEYELDSIESRVLGWIRSKYHLKTIIDNKAVMVQKMAYFCMGADLEPAEAHGIAEAAWRTCSSILADLDSAETEELEAAAELMKSVDFECTICHKPTPRRFLMQKNRMGGMVCLECVEMRRAEDHAKQHSDAELARLADELWKEACMTLDRVWWFLIGYGTERAKALELAREAESRIIKAMK